jgi:hypothetical protein
MPFELTNAPATFQAIINDVLQEHLDNFVVIYLDNILIYLCNEQDHISHVSAVLKKLQDADLQVKLKKYVFYAQSVKFLGFIISPDGICMAPCIGVHYFYGNSAHFLVDQTYHITGLCSL